MFNVICNKETYKVYSVKYDNNGETYFLVYDNNKKGWY
jgi:hypothetical protein